MSNGGSSDSERSRGRGSGEESMVERVSREIAESYEPLDRETVEEIIGPPPYS